MSKSAGIGAAAWREYYIEAARRLSRGRGHHMSDEARCGLIRHYIAAARAYNWQLIKQLRGVV